LARHMSNKQSTAAVAVSVSRCNMYVCICCLQDYSFRGSSSMPRSWLAICQNQSSAAVAVSVPCCNMYVCVCCLQDYSLCGASCRPRSWLWSSACQQHCYAHGAYAAALQCERAAGDVWASAAAAGQHCGA
jgi:hypothetical protein